MKFNKLIISICIIFTLIIFGWFYLNRPKLSDKPIVYHWNNNCKSSYSFKINTVSQYGSKNTEKYSISIKGILNAYFIVNKNNVETTFQISNIDVKSNGFPDRLLEKLYTVPFKVEMDKTGLFKSFIFPKSLPDEDKEMLQQFISVFETILPKTKTKNYVAKQSDKMGNYIANYKRNNKTGHKQKLKYISSNSTLMPVNTEIIQSDFEFTISNKCWLETLQGKEDLKIYTGAGSNNFSTEGKTEVMLNKFDKPLDSVLWEDTNIIENYNYNELNYNISIRERRKNESLDKIIEREKINLVTLINSLNKNDKNFELLKRYLETHNAEIKKIPDLILNGKLSDKAVSKVIMMLGLIGSSEAQYTLIDIWENESFSDKNRLRAVIAFSSLRELPVEDLFSLLTSKFYLVKSSKQNSELLTTPVLVLGSVVKNINDRYHNEAKELNSKLIDYLSNTSDDMQIKILLLALGNSRFEGNDEIISSYIDSDSKTIRDAAIHSASRYQSDALSESLLKALKTEKELDIKENIYKALQNQNLNKEQLSTIKLEVFSTNEEIRAMAIRTLGNFKKVDPEGIDKILKKAYKTEISRDNIKLIIKVFNMK